jgi:hypothetical protein
MNLPPESDERLEPSLWPASNPVRSRPELHGKAKRIRLSDSDLAAHCVAFVSEKQECFACALTPAPYIRFECGAIGNNFKNVSLCHFVGFRKHFERRHGAFKTFAIEQLGGHEKLPIIIIISRQRLVIPTRKLTRISTALSTGFIHLLKCNILKHS